LSIGRCAPPGQVRALTQLLVHSKRPSQQRQHIATSSNRRTFCSDLGALTRA